jgi:hypothetical protein
MEHAMYTIGHSRATVGDWVTLEPGVPLDMEVVATDNAYNVASFIVAVEASHDWLFENYENLRQRYVINYIDEKCRRVYPTQPRAVLY